MERTHTHTQKHSTRKKKDESCISVSMGYCNCQIQYKISMFGRLQNYNISMKSSKELDNFIKNYMEFLERYNTVNCKT